MPALPYCTWMKISCFKVSAWCVEFNKRRRRRRNMLWCLKLFCVQFLCDFSNNSDGIYFCKKRNLVQSVGSVFVQEHSIKCNTHSWHAVWRPSLYSHVCVPSAISKWSDACNQTAITRHISWWLWLNVKQPIQGCGKIFMELVYRVQIIRNVALGHDAFETLQTFQWKLVSSPLNM